MSSKSPLFLIVWSSLVAACSLRSRFTVVEGGLDADASIPVDARDDTQAADDVRDAQQPADVRCAVSETACGGRCVDTQRDSLNCGACGARCATGEGLVGFACVEGRCVGGCDAGSFVGDAAGGRCVRVARPIAPMSGSFVQGATFELRFTDVPADVSGNRVRLCTDAACLSELAGVSMNLAAGASVATFTLDAAQRAMFTTGYVYWQLVNAMGQSPVWSLRLVPDPTPLPAANAASARRVRAAFGASADFTGDGRDELIVSAEVSGVRRVYVVTPPMGGGAVPTFTGPLSLASGYAASDVIARAGDVNGDGYSDFAVGGVPRDKVFVFLGGLNAVAATPIVLEAPPSSTAFGSNITAAGDLDRDGYGDLAIADENAPEGMNNGRVTVYWGGPSGPSSAVRTPVTTVEPVDERSRFGTALAGACDLDGDGAHDLIVSAPQSATPSVYMYRGVGRSFSAERRLRPASERRFGGALACLGDVDNDGDHEWVTETESTTAMVGPVLVVYSGSDVVSDLSFVTRMGATLGIAPEPVQRFLPVFDLARDAESAGRLDIAYLGRSGPNVSVNVYVNRGASGFSAVDAVSLSAPSGTNQLSASILYTPSGEPALVVGAPTLGTIGAIAAVGASPTGGFRQPAAADFVQLVAMPAGASRVGEVMLR